MKIKIRKIKNLRMALVYFEESGLQIANPPIMDLEIEYEDNNGKSLIEASMTFNCITGMYRTSFGVLVDNMKTIEGKEINEYWLKNRIAEVVNGYFREKEAMINTLFSQPIVLCESLEINKEIYNRSDW